MIIDDPKIAKAIELLQQHERAARACMDFLKAENSFGTDPISLKLWVADRISKPDTSNADPSSVAQIS